MTKEKVPFPSDVADKFMLRFPEGMRDEISKAAKTAGRTMNAEVITRLRESLSASCVRLPDEIRAAIDKAAQDHGWPFESELLHRVVDSLQDLPEIDRLRLQLEDERKESAALREQLESELAEKRKHSTMLYVLLDTHSQPISWAAIHAYAEGIRSLNGFNPREMNISVITPEVESSSPDAAMQADTARIYRGFGKGAEFTTMAYNDEAPELATAPRQLAGRKRKPKA